MYQENLPSFDAANRKGLAKRTSKEAEPSRLQPVDVTVSQANATNTEQTLGDLVELAYKKNKLMKAQALTGDEPALLKTVLQRALWEGLRKSFFAENTDTDALADAPASITKEEARSYVTIRPARAARRRVSSNVLVAKQPALENPKLK